MSDDPFEGLTPDQIEWLRHSEELWRKAHAIVSRRPDLDVSDVYHSLRNLELSPSERLREGLTRVRRRKVPRRTSMAEPLRKPQLDPDPITGDELWDHAPEKIELVDGRIPGDEKLLLLILKGMGLRRAVKIVGRELWARALEDTE
jgi:hypothetical protein